MEHKHCQNCAHYKQHYALDEKKIFRINCGHCMKYRAKHKKPDSAACDNFIFSEPDENAFVNKAYLSKVLLEYLVHMELLPTIEDKPE